MIWKTKNQVDSPESRSVTLVYSLRCWTLQHVFMSYQNIWMDAMQWSFNLIWIENSKHPPIIIWCPTLPPLWLAALCLSQYECILLCPPVESWSLLEACHLALLIDAHLAHLSVLAARAIPTGLVWTCNTKMLQRFRCKSKRCTLKPPIDLAPFPKTVRRTQLHSQPTTAFVAIFALCYDSCEPWNHHSCSCLPCHRCTFVCFWPKCGSKFEAQLDEIEAQSFTTILPVVLTLATFLQWNYQVL